MNQITIDGKVYNLVPVEDETEVEANEEQKHTGWERKKEKEQDYYIFSSRGNIFSNGFDTACLTDDHHYNYGNYFSNEQLAKDMARATSLWLRLNRFAAENQKEKIDWNDRDVCKWVIVYNYDCNELDTNFNTVLKHIIVYFDSEETAKKAIEEFKDELTWYFTEFKNTRRFE